MHESSACSSIPTKILVPIDFSDSSHSALVTAAELAKHFQAELYLVHVIPIFSRTTFPDFLPETRFLEKLRKDAESHFAACEIDLGAKGFKVNSCIEEGNDVVGNIVDVIDREKIDFVVVSDARRDWLASNRFRVDCRKACETRTVPAFASSHSQARFQCETFIGTIDGMVVAIPTLDR